MKKIVSLICTLLSFFSGYAQLAAPQLDTPSNNSSQYTRLQFSWYNSRGCNAYILQLDTTPTFNSPLLRISPQSFSATNTNTFLYSDHENDLLFNTDYYWRVCAINANDTSAWSEVRQFHTTICPTLDSPSNNSSQYTRLQFSWYNSRGCNAYILQLDTTPTFNSPLLRISPQSFSATNTNTFLYSNYENDLLFNTDYYWRVCAINANDTSAWSEVRQFHTVGSPTLYAPADNAVLTSRDVQLSVSRRQDCTNYAFQLDTSASFSSSLSQTYNVSIPESYSSNTVQSSVSNLRYGATYHWRVRCSNQSDTSDWSAARTFSTPCQPTAPELSVPENGATGQSCSLLILFWYPQSGMTSYRYEVSTSNTFDTLFASGNTSSTFVTLTGLAPYQTYYWRVRGSNNDGPTVYSSVWHFTIQGIPITTPTPYLPSNGSYVRVPNPTLKWTSSNGADHYEVQFGADSATLASIPAYSTDSTQFTIQGLPEHFTFYWRVRGICTGHDTSNWSAVNHFTTLFCQDSYDTLSISICDGNSYTFFDQTLAATGTYAHTLANTSGCDSIVTLHLSVMPNRLDGQEQMTTCDSYLWKDSAYTQSGTYTFDTLTADGCDSLVTLTLTINYSHLDGQELMTACDSFLWKDSAYTQSGTYAFDTLTADGCDSLVMLALTINHSVETFVADTANGQYIWNDSLYTASGNYVQTLTTVNGCDSIVTLGLFILPLDIQPLDSQNPMLRLMPNPARSQVSICWNVPSPAATLIITDINGKILLRKEVGDQTSCQMAVADGKISAGIYFVVLVTPQGTSTQRLVVQ